MIQLKSYLKCLREHKFTQEQFLFLFCLFNDDIEALIEYKKVFGIGDNEPLLGEIYVDDLIDREYLNKLDNHRNTNSYSVSEKFANIFIDPYLAGNEIWDMYPAKATSKGNVYPLTLMDKNLFRQMYGDRINYLKEEHEEIKKDLAYAIQNGLISYGIEKFVRSEQWTSIRKERLGTEKEYATSKSIEDDLL